MFANTAEFKRFLASEPTPRRITYPLNRVVGIMNSPGEAYRAGNALIGAGFLEAELHVASGVRAADALHFNTGHRSLADWLMRLAASMGISNGEMEVKDQYEEALRHGGTLVAVEASANDRMHLAAAILAACGARTVVGFGRFSFTELAAPAPRLRLVSR